MTQKNMNPRYYVMFKNSLFFNGRSFKPYRG